MLGYGVFSESCQLPLECPWIFRNFLHQKSDAVSHEFAECFGVVFFPA